MATLKPLILDVDGTFLKTDMLLETFWQALGRHPSRCLGACVKYLNNRARLKKELADLAELRTDLLPVNLEIKALADKCLEQGRAVCFASGSDQSLVARLSKEHGLGEDFLASDGSTNLTGKKKAQALVSRYGQAGFDYAGNSRADGPVWQVAENAITVGSFAKLAREMAQNGSNVEEFRGGYRARDLIRALRPHQWVKNVLLFLPLIAAHRFDASGFGLVFMAALAFSAAASSIYIVNDLLDLEADRLHPTKRNRPFASGAVPIGAGMIAAFVLGIGALVLAGTLLNGALTGVLALYMTLSLAYSLKLKRMRWVDIATLAALYTIRVIAGAVAAQVVASGYLIAFIFPTFIALGCVKRLTELTLATSNDKLPGRGYGRGDRGDLLNVAGLGTIGALLAFFLYSFTGMAAELYPNIWQLWLALIPIAGWLVRMVVLGWQGKQDYDPIVFAMRDKYGLALIALTLTLMFTAATPH